MTLQPDWGNFLFLHTRIRIEDWTTLCESQQAYWSSRNTVGAGKVTRLRDRWSGLRIRVAIEDRSPLQNVETANGAQSAISSMVGGCSFVGSRAAGRQGWILTFPLVPRLRIGGGKPPFHHIPSRNTRNNFFSTTINFSATEMAPELKHIVPWMPTDVWRRVVLYIEKLLKTAGHPGKLFTYKTTRCHI